MKKITQFLILLIALATFVAGGAFAGTSNGNSNDVGSIEFPDLFDLDGTLLAGTSNGNSNDVGSIEFPDLFDLDGTLLAGTSNGNSNDVG